jgi:Ca2+-transporting ATPase
LLPLGYFVADTKKEEMNWHRLSISDTLKMLGSGTEGLSSMIANERLLQYGANELQERKKKSAAALLLSQFKDVMILILMGAAVISGIIGDLEDTVVILVIVILNALVGFFQEYKAEKAIQALKKMAVTQASAMRDGKLTLLPATELVPGDVVHLEAGNAVPADIRIIKSVHLKVDESSLTGESQAINKSTDALETDELNVGDRLNMGFKGTFITAGRGSGVVVETGMQTELGRIAFLLQQEKKRITPLQKRMASFGRKLSALVLFLCVLFFVAGWYRGEEILKLILTSISLAVAAIPEALPAVITISLALAAKKMIRIQCLIRKLPAVETLGSVTYICTDKTGTITKNSMHVEAVFVNKQCYDRETIKSAQQLPEVALLMQAFSLNNDVVEDSGNVVKGDSTEIALMEMAREQQIKLEQWPRLAEIAFDSDRKLMTTFHRHNEKIISFTKGAPDILLKQCTEIETAFLQQQVDGMAEKGNRVLGFAYRYWDQLPIKTDHQLHERNLQFLGLASLIDPPREDVFDAVAQCKSAGIIPVIITGDHPLTAKNIAMRVGILKEKGDEMITGQELSSMSHDRFLARVEKIRVYARVSPQQKLEIISALQEKGHFVAMTGDGINDAPALKHANIGIAMGITGTDVSKEAADMILLDDNFSTIVKAIKEGRRIYDNILKVIKYLVTSNSGELWTLLIGPMIGLPVALLPIHILWINLVTDGLPAISLSFEKAEKDIMNRPPRPPQESVFSNHRGTQMVWVGLLMAVIALCTQSWAIRNGLHWQTIIFNVMCLCQMGHVLAIRSQHESFFTLGILSNKPLVGAVTLTFLLQLVITYSPSLQPIFKTASLGWQELLLVGIASSTVFFAVEMEKLFSRIKIKKSGKFMGI